MKHVTLAILATGLLTLLISASPESTDSSQAADTQAGAQYLKNVQHGNPDLKRIGRLGFGPQGLLLVADPAAATVVAIQTDDHGPVQKLKQKISNVDALIAGAMGTEAEGVNIIDMAVNPESGLIYLSVQRKQDNQYAILTVNAEGKVAALDLEQVKFVKVNLPLSEGAAISNITGVEFSKDRVLAAGQSNEEFISKIYSLPLPLTHGANASVYSTETYHVAHGRWETRAPIQSFVPYEEDGKSYIVGSFSCTPIAKFPLDDIQSGSQVKGTSVVELGSGNRPVDMFTYKKDGKQWLITNTDRFHHERSPLGPSQYWGVRVDMSYLSAQETNEEATRRDVSAPKGPQGIEVVEQLFFAKHVDKLSETEMLVLRDNQGHLDLEISLLP
ncbi:MAG: hypothetical protein MK165_06745 [Pirellulaceae bacterium]|nr:hypothetical protein [Pirellulaceae bacterium]